MASVEVISESSAINGFQVSVSNPEKAVNDWLGRYRGGKHITVTSIFEKIWRIGRRKNVVVKSN